MRHECELCDNPYPYMCAECQGECFGPAASRVGNPTASMGKEFLNSSISPAEPQIKKVNISSGEDAVLYEVAT